jgi:2-keto-3-deoxy-L-rhamnonate aldolase RhmA
MLLKKMVKCMTVRNNRLDERRGIMRENPIKMKLKDGRVAIGVWQGLDCPGNAEILADAGFDFIVFDTEHGHYTTTSLIACLDAVRRTDISPMIRVAANDPTLLKQILELGPEGVVIPMVCTKKEAEAAVAGCKYPPQGIRGIGAGRASHYGAEFKTYLEQANKNVLVVIQIEHVTAVQNIQEIAQVHGIDCMFIGPMDLSASMGITGQTTHPDMIAAIEKVMAAGKNEGLPTGMFCRNEEHVAEMIARGMQFFSYTEDKSLLASAAQASLRKMKELSGRAAGL